MAMVICPHAKTCGAKLIVTDKKDQIPTCDHQVKHEHTGLCNNGICSRVMPQSSRCIPVDVPVVAPELPIQEKLAEMLAAPAEPVVVPVVEPLVAAPVAVQEQPVVTPV